MYLPQLSYEGERIKADESVKGHAKESESDEKCQLLDLIFGDPLPITKLNIQHK